MLKYKVGTRNMFSKHLRICQVEQKILLTVLLKQSDIRTKFNVPVEQTVLIFLIMTRIILRAEAEIRQLLK